MRQLQIYFCGHGKRDDFDDSLALGSWNHLAKHTVGPLPLARISDLSDVNER